MVHILHSPDSQVFIRGVENSPYQAPQTTDYHKKSEFPNGEVAEFTANLIAENMWSQCDAEGNQHGLLDELVDFKSDGKAVQPADKYVWQNGRRHLRKTTAG